MKKSFSRFLGVFLCLAILMSIVSPTFAAVTEDSGYRSVPAVEKVEQTSQPEPVDSIAQEQMEIEIAQQAYASFTDEQKLYFEQVIAGYPELVEYHQTYVNADYDLSNVVASISSSDPVSILMAEIAALALPTAVVYAINATGVGMVAAVADGPLPVGDIILAAAAASLAITCALNWTVVSTKWNKIVLAFQHAFVASVNNVLSAFNDIWIDSVKEYYDDDNPVTVSPNTKSITYDGNKYNCRTLAEEAADKLQTNSYYPAVIGPDNKVYICTAPVPEEVAKLLVVFGDEHGVIFAKTQASALRLCNSLSSVVFGPEYHGSYSNQPGFWRHYHVVINEKTHIWYNSKVMV